MMGVVSLTECPKNLLMWAHYAGEHTGFVIEVDPQHATFNERRSEDDDFRHLRKVHYSSTRPNLQMVKIEYVSFILTKSTEWSYEKEWRISKITAAAVKNIPAEPYNICLFEFPASCIKSITLGARSNGSLLSRMQAMINTRLDLRHIQML